MRWVVAAAAVGAGLGGGALESVAAPASEFQVFNYNLLGDGTVELPGRLYVPPGLEPGEKRPLVLFLHGLGERGTNNTNQVNANIDGLFEQAKAQGFYLYAPQRSTSGSSWDNAHVDMAMGMVAQATRQHAVDTDHIYVTGISMGGGGTKTAISRYRDNLAAAVPLSATSPGGIDYAGLVGKPIWLYHGAFDSTVSANESGRFVNEIRAAEGKTPIPTPSRRNPENSVPFTNNGGPYYPYQYTDENGTTITSTVDFYDENNLRYSLFHVGGHTTARWTQYYREPWLYEWMWEQSNPQPRLQQDQSVAFDLGAAAALSGKDSQGRTWNAPLNGEERTLATAIPFANFSDTGGRSGVSLTVTDAFAGVADRGRGGGPFDASVTRDTWTVSEANPGAILIDGLTPGGTYRVEIFASDTDSDGGRGRMTRYTIGDAFLDLEVYNNLTDFAIFEEVVADPLGRFELVVAVTPGSGARFGGIGTLRVTAIPEPAAVAFLATPAAIAAARRRRPIPRAGSAPGPRLDHP